MNLSPTGLPLCPTCGRLASQHTNPLAHAFGEPYKMCKFCRRGIEGFDSAEPARCRTPGCPGNPETASTEDPRLLVAIRDAVVAEACRWRGIDKPRACGEFTRIEDIFRYAQVALKVVREFDVEGARG